MSTDTSDTDTSPKAEGTEPSDQYSHLPKCIARYLRELDQSRENALKRVDLAALLEEAVVGFDDLSPNIVPFNFDVTVYVYVKDTMTRVVDLIRVLRRRGFKMAGHHDNPENRTRLYHMSPESGEGLGICIYANIYGADNARCKYVKVGEKTVPVMALHCEGDEVTP